MKELNIVEVNAVSGAGRLQDAMTSFGGRIGTKFGGEKGAALVSDLSNKLGGRIETALKGIPVVGKLIGKLLG